MKKGGLGKGLDSLIGKKPAVIEDVSRETFLMMAEIEPNREQPRKQFDEEAIDELAESIRQHGIIQPLIVVKKDGYYQIVAGERRWRAAKKVGLKKVPVIIKEYTKREIDEIALIENIQRENLNPMEEAHGLKTLMKEYGLKQEDLVKVISKSRSYIANSVRLLNLPQEIQELVSAGKLSGGHGRALLGLPEMSMQTQAAAIVLEKEYTVRETEELVNKLKNPPKKKPEKRRDTALEQAEKELESSLGTKVVISGGAKRGKIQISYHSLEELERLIEWLQREER